MALNFSNYDYGKHGLQVDLDLGASGAIAIKDKYIITGGKQGPIYIADASNLGGYQPTANNSNIFQVPFFFPLQFLLCTNKASSSPTSLCVVGTVAIEIRLMKIEYL